MKTPNILGQRKTERVQHCITFLWRRERIIRFPHEHSWINSVPNAEVAIALVSGWVGQGRVAVRFTHQTDNLWYVYSYPIGKFLCTIEDPNAVQEHGQNPDHPRDRVERPRTTT